MRMPAPAKTAAVAAFRADASIQIGSGHIMRSLTLADELSRRGVRSLFVTRELPGHLAELIHERGHAYTLLPPPPPTAALTPAALDDPPQPPHAPWLGVPWEQDADETLRALQEAGACDLLIVDHYSLDARWQRRLRAGGRRILVIDDLADRPLDCDLLLDYNLQETDAQLVPAGCHMLLGLSHALLRPQFIAARETLRRRDGRVRRILVFVGGSDPDNLTARALAAIAQLADKELWVDVVLGANSARRKEVAAMCERMGQVASHFNVLNMAALMKTADLAIGAAGVTTWERACLGLPALVATIAANQRPIAAAAARSGVLTWLGDARNLTVAELAAALRTALASPEVLAAQSRRGLQLVDGRGTARVADALLAGDTEASADASADADADAND